MLDQYSIVLYLHKKGLLPKEMHNDLVATLAPDAMRYRTVARYVHDAKCTYSKVTSPPDSISHQFHKSDHAILLALEEQSFRQFDNSHVPPIYHSRQFTVTELAH
jgi:hypothetical protein